MKGKAKAISSGFHSKFNSENLDCKQLVCSKRIEKLGGPKCFIEASEKFVLSNFQAASNSYITRSNSMRSTNNSTVDLKVETPKVDFLLEDHWHFNSVLSPKGSLENIMAPNEEEMKAQLEEERKEMQKVFNTLDLNGDGFISIEELQELMAKLDSPSSAEEIELMLKSVDENGDGLVDFEEFISLHKSSKNEEEEEQELYQAFRLFDRNNDGFISAQELHTVLSNLGFVQQHKVKKCEHMIRGVDSDGDGLVNFSEFKLMMSPRQSAPIPSF